VKILVLGLGNLLLADEGVGVHAARALALRGYGDNVTVLDTGTAILDALEYIAQADIVIVVDALKGGEKPGSVYKISFDDCKHPDCIASMHGFDLSRVIALTGRKDIPPVIVIGVEPLKIDWSMELSPAIEKVLPAVINEVDKIIGSYVTR